MAQSQLIVLLLVCGYCGWRGRREVRILALALIAAMLATMWLEPLNTRHDVQWLTLAVDALLAVLATILALRRQPRWLTAFAALAWVGASTHLVMAIDLAVRANAYLTMAALATYGQVICLVAALILDWRLKGTMAGEPTS